MDTMEPRTYLLLHGGGGVHTMTAFGNLLAERAGARVLAPTHPGFGGTPQPAELTGVTGLARHYVTMLDELGLTGVTVLGNSFGGWLAAEIALCASARVSAAVIVNGIGVEVDGHPVTDIRGFTLAEIQAHSWHDPAKAPTPSGTGPSPDVRALIGYTGPSMSDPTLLDRLGDVRIPVHVLWGESDRIVDAAYGKAYAAAIPGSTFTPLPRTGHLPQLETPEELLEALLG
ncbi:pimeloyl-ACP methyl ester carboxylesterase [Lentzea atacamensis]|uniref:Pimeloyl-ACP methyl ester carboxylesterase n=1 Tax=Lentzea atacamensis TaxID=531938 RepID=A0ABX9EIQ4_9PSEU|nr:alpha/beta hydrolase [Lentzea atacamensis]RAS71072.1 pimeloyl-ACP methyl ester carboxylesterase [Lentzea atacamensis]